MLGAAYSNNNKGEAAMLLSQAPSRPSRWQLSVQRLSLALVSFHQPAVWMRSLPLTRAGSWSSRIQCL
jgi:hypothetical protein